MKEQLWCTYINKNTFASIWKNTMKKTQQHRIQQNKIWTTIEIIQQYWKEDVWNRYFDHRWYIYAEVEIIRKLARKCHDWSTASWFVFILMYQCLQSWIQDQHSFKQILLSDWTWADAEHINYVNKNLHFTSNLDLRNHSDLDFTVQFFLSCSWTSSWFFISFSLCQITTSYCFKIERFILQFIEKISEFSSQLIMFLNFCECCSISSFHDDDNNNNNIIHFYSRENSVLHQYAEEHSHVWSCNATFTLTSISIRQKLTDSDLWVLEMLEFIFSSYS